MHCTVQVQNQALNMKHCALSVECLQSSGPRLDLHSNTHWPVNVHTVGASWPESVYGFATLNAQAQACASDLLCWNMLTALNMLVSPACRCPTRNTGILPTSI